MYVCVFAGVRPVSVDRQAAGAHEWSPSLGRHPAGLPLGVGGHWVRVQPGNSHRLPAHPVSTGTTHTYPLSKKENIAFYKICKCTFKKDMLPFKGTFPVVVSALSTHILSYSYSTNYHIFKKKLQNLGTTVFPKCLICKSNTDSLVFR